MRYQTLLVGDRRPRLRALGVTGVLVFICSVGFVAGIQIAFGTLLGLCSVVVALYAGIMRGGLLAAQCAIFSSICWRAVFPPLVGYLRWGDAGYETIRDVPARYNSLRTNHLFLGPEGELEWGVEFALQEGILVAFFVGGFLYGTGALYRRLRRENPSTQSSVE